MKCFKLIDMVGSSQILAESITECFSFGVSVRCEASRTLTLKHTFPLHSGPAVGGRWKLVSFHLNTCARGRKCFLRGGVPGFRVVSAL